MSSQETRRKWNIGEDSDFKMIVYFRDGNIRCFYSMDWKSSLSRHKDSELGLKRLKKLAATYLGIAATIVIYDLKSDTCLIKYINGRAISP